MKLEQRHPFVGGGDPNRRMDIVIAGGVLRLPPTAHEPQGGGARDACIDVTIVDGTRDVHCEAAAKDIGTVLMKASLEKFKTYGPLLDRRRSTLYPAAIDQFGAMCAEVHSLYASLLDMSVPHPPHSRAEARMRGACRNGASVFLSRFSVPSRSQCLRHGAVHALAVLVRPLTFPRTRPRAFLSHASPLSLGQRRQLAPLE